MRGFFLTFIQFLNFFRQILFPIIVGLVFILSAILKIYPTEPFEFILIESGFADWDSVQYISRIIIGSELAIGTFLLLGIKPHLTRKIGIGVILLFSLNLFLQLNSQPEQNCGCMGEYISLTPMEALIKNVILLALLYFMLPIKYIKLNVLHKYSWILIVISLALPFILYPPDLYSTPPPMNGEMLFEASNAEIAPLINEVSNEKSIVCFFSMGCKFCKLTARKLSVIDDQFDADLPIYFFFFGEESRLEKFMIDSRSNPYPHGFLPTQSFFNYSGNKLPAVFLLENGKIHYKLGFRELDGNQIIEFLDLE